MTKSRYKSRIRPVAAVHATIWVVVGFAFIILSAACLVAVITGAVQTFPGMTSLRDVGKNVLQIILALGVCAIFGFGGRSLVRSGYETSSRKSEFDRGSAIVEGRVVKRHKVRRKASGPYDNDRTCWFVDVQFPTDSGQVSLRAEVSKKVHDSVSPDQVVRVKYATADPRIALVEGEFGQ